MLSPIDRPSSIHMTDKILPVNLSSVLCVDHGGFAVPCARAGSSCSSTLMGIIFWVMSYILHLSLDAKRDDVAKELQIRILFPDPRSRDYCHYYFRVCSQIHWLQKEKLLTSRHCQEIQARRLVAAGAAADIRSVYFFVVKTYTKLPARINDTTLPVYVAIDNYKKFFLSNKVLW